MFCYHKALLRGDAFLIVNLYPKHILVYSILHNINYSSFYLFKNS